jgi:hypothetical protein
MPTRIISPAKALNARGVATARGVTWSPVQVLSIEARVTTAFPRAVLGSAHTREARVFYFFLFQYAVEQPFRMAMLCRPRLRRHPTHMPPTQIIAELFRSEGYDGVA